MDNIMFYNIGDIIYFILIKWKKMQCGSQPTKSPRLQFCLSNGNRPFKEMIFSQRLFCYMLQADFCLAYSSTLKMEAKCSSETPVDF
jgi:hypothetical protein